MKELRTGVPASNLFRALRRQDSSVGEVELCKRLAEAFPAVSSKAFDAIRRWLEPDGGSDWLLDSVMQGYLEDAGYLEEPRSPHRAISHLLDHHVPSDESEHEDAIWLLRRIVQRMRDDFGHSIKESVELVNCYFDRFCNPSYAAQINYSVQDIEWVFREEESGMSARVQYYVTLGSKVDEMAFIAWFNALVKKQRSAANVAPG
ncbi:hypothetical protein ACQ86G_28595 [Roseateles chitinivorans]|uniref:hypothetical protein n=1 Tax=Roseateles chitinivorans TaxID=2917965 RepID=UPI003D67C80F